MREQKLRINVWKSPDGNSVEQDIENKINAEQMNDTKTPSKKLQQVKHIKINNFRASFCCEKRGDPI